MAKTTTVSLAEQLKGEQFCLLTTFRADGTPVPTAMWFAIKNDQLYMATKGGTGKVKRLRRDGKVTIGPCNGSGRPTGQQHEAIARVLDSPSESAEAERTLMARYGLKRRLLRWALRFSKDKTDVHISVTLGGQ